MKRTEGLMFAIRATVASVAVLVVASPVARAAEPDVRVLRDGSPLTVSNPDRVADLLVAVVESSSVNSTKYFLPEGRWNTAASAPSLVHVKFPSGRVLRVMDAASRAWRPTRVDEILVVVPGDAWPD